MGNCKRKKLMNLKSAIETIQMKHREKWLEKKWSMSCGATPKGEIQVKLGSPEERR